MLARLRALTACFVLAATGARAQTTGPFVNFEAQHTRPVCLSPDGTRLFVVSTPDARLSVFDVSNPSNPLPVLIREIRTGIDPVAVNAVSSDEAWVVNELSDSVSIVSVSSGVAVATLPCRDEPGDVVFAGGKAFVSCARNNGIRIFDTVTRQELAFVSLTSPYPKALAVNAAGDRVHAVSKFSGNRTTLLPVNLAPPQPAPANPALPAPPAAGLIVTADDSRLSPKPNMPDNDVAEINVSTLAVTRYFKGVGTINFAAAVRPGASGELWIANTEARNLVRFEPVLKGRSVDNRLTRVTTGATPVVTPFDLNPGINYSLFPNPSALATAIAQPAAIAFEPDGAHLWVASFGTDRLARVNAATGAIVSRVDTGPPASSPNPTREKRGPRGLAWQAATGRLYVVNRLSNTIMVVNGSSGTLLGEMPCGTHDPTPQVIREGRGFLYDAKLSGNGTQSCASCHIDGDRDDLAWDLGDPGGSMDTATSTIPQTGTTITVQLHPMKGPMTTQTLRGIKGTDPLHWRGDRAGFNHFNGAFAALLGGPLLSTADMNAFKAFVETMVYHPNPHQNLDRTLPATFESGNPAAGRHTYLNEVYAAGLTCNTCHALPTGHSALIIPASALQEPQPFKVPQLRNLYQKRGFVRSATTVSLSGFGLTHDGMDPDLVTFLSRPVFGTFATDTTRKRNLAAFVNCLDTGTAPACGHSRTIVAATLTAAGADWTLLEGQAVAAPANCDLIVHGLVGGARRSWLYRPATNDYAPDDGSSTPVSRATLQGYVSSGATLTLMGVPPGSGPRMALDRDGDAVRDADETLPHPVLLTGPSAALIWPAAEWGLVPEQSANLQTWNVVTSPRSIVGGTLTLPIDGTPSRGYFRLSRP